MPAYNNSPFARYLRLLIAGVPAYFFGSWKQDVSPTQMYVSSVALAANVATVGVTVYGGEVPTVGSAISLQGTQSAGGAFNAQNATLLSVTLNSAGVGTVTFALNGANLATTADAGIAVVPQPEVPEAIVNGASVAVAMSNNSFGGDLDKTMTAVANFPTMPNACVVSLQGSMFNQDAQFVTLGEIAAVAGGQVTQNGFTFSGNYLFYRALVSGVGGAGTITCKIEA